MNNKYVCFHFMVVTHQITFVYDVIPKLQIEKSATNFDVYKY